MKTILLIISLFYFITLTFGKPHEKKDRIYDRDLSDEEHIVHSSKDSEEDESKHNPSYDHEAFLGEEESKVFDQLTPEESKRRLENLVKNKIDKDHDNVVSEQELHDWIHHTSRKYVEENRDKHWSNYKPNDAGLLSWETYKLTTFGDEKNPNKGQENLKGMLSMMSRDEGRWKLADADGDSMLNKDEFLAFLHPEEVPRMHPLVVDETIGDMDKNGDGFVDLDEYIGDLWKPEKENEPEPKWVATEREQFGIYRDKNKDGRLDRDEIHQWILPQDYDHVEAETTHLMNHADTDHDKRLTMQEILDHYDVFVGSQATDFGEALNQHEEL
jgi:calumenin